MHLHVRHRTTLVTSSKQLGQLLQRIKRIIFSSSGQYYNLDIPAEYISTRQHQQKKSMVLAPSFSFLNVSWITMNPVYILKHANSETRSSTFCKQRHPVAHSSKPQPLPLTGIRSFVRSTNLFNCCVVSPTRNTRQIRGKSSLPLVKFIEHQQWAGGELH